MSEFDIVGLLMSRMAGTNFEIPERVLIRPDYATTLAGAMGENCGRLSVIFIRGDGWTLGAPAGLINEAFEMWKKEWVGYISYPFLNGHVIRPMGQFKDDYNWTGWPQFKPVLRKF